MISAQNITMQFGAKPLFEKVTIKFGEGHRYGLIGANGSGKSTFMKILGDDLEPTQGHVALDPGLRLGKLRQDQFAFEEIAVIETVILGHRELAAVKQERDAIYGNPEASEADYLRAAALEAQFGELGGYDAEARAAILLLGVGIPETQHTLLMREIAPGFKLRVLLAQALFADPDVLLLDEPTNNLDINTIRWLEKTLNERSATIVVISHDRHFLNAICTHMADLDYREIRIYPGNYDDYMIASAESRARLLSDNARKKDQIADLQAFVARFKANKSKARQATSRLRQADKLKQDMVTVKPSSRQSPYLRFETDEKTRLHRQAVELSRLSKKYDKRLFNQLTLIVEAGQRLAVLGPNGAGKSTLLKLLVGEEKPDQGETKWAEKATIGYFPQDHQQSFKTPLTLFDWIQQWAQPGDDDQTLRATLGRLLFSGEEGKKTVDVLSGGERCRMLLGKLLLQRPNVLILDEPTNHLDMESIEALNVALEQYAGTLIFVSHDRQFVSSLATQIIELDGLGGFRHYLGGYDDYLSSQGLE